MSDLEDLGWDTASTRDWEALESGEGWVPARVVAEFRDAFVVHGEAGQLRAELAGKLWHAIGAGAARPAVGDWVAVEARAAEGTATIHAVLPRRTGIVRKEPGKRSTEQVLAANVDILFIVTSLDRDFNLRRIERYLALVWDSGALPVILLTKADLCADIAARVAAAAAVAPGVAVHALSARNGDGLAAVRAHLGRGRTAALLGSSGVGKSTLVNALLGAEVLEVRAVREDDDRGRHTTTSRQMFQVPGGGLVLDTPGLRELQLWDAEAGVEGVFAEVETLAHACRFRDCRHESEPACAVQAALRSGTLAPDRLESRRKLQRELDRLAAKRDAALRAERTRRERQMRRAARQFYERRGKRDRRDRP